MTLYLGSHVTTPGDYSQNGVNKCGSAVIIATTSKTVINAVCAPAAHIHRVTWDRRIHYERRPTSHRHAQLTVKATSHKPCSFTSREHAQ